MIAFRVELWCDGCHARFLPGNGGAHDTCEALPELSEYLIRDSILAGWTIDGAAHWCPSCTLVRKATEGNGKLGIVA